MAVKTVNTEIKDIVEKYADLVNRKIKVEKMYLFGSYADGTYNADSDIDVAVVSDCFTGDPVEDMLILMRLRRKLDIRIEPHPFMTEDFDETNPYAHEIINSGVRVL
jgi:predicted nucleotidyltransferase